MACNYDEIFTGDEESNENNFANYSNDVLDDDEVDKGEDQEQFLVDSEREDNFLDLEGI